MYNLKRFSTSALKMLRDSRYRKLMLLMLFNRFFSDKKFLELMFPLRTGMKLNLKNPKTFNEKLQWLKLYDRDPLYTKMVDKVEAKDWASNIIGESYIVQTIAVYDSVNEIMWDKLPDSFVIKCSHDSGGLVICKDKSKLDLNKAKNKLSKALRTKYYNQNREWPYKNVKPRIIVEEYMEDSSTQELMDYKFFCFNGKPVIMFVASDRQKSGEEVKFDFFDMDFNHLPIRNGHPNSCAILPKPLKFEEMKNLAAMLSKGIPHVRIDFYEVNGQIYFGEATFFHFSGFVPFEPNDWDYKLGDMISLPQGASFSNDNIR